MRKTDLNETDLLMLIEQTIFDYDYMPPKLNMRKLCADTYES